MGREVFRWLLHDVMVGTDGTLAYFSGVAEPVRGRFWVDPILVPGSPAESGLRTTEIWFYYDTRIDFPQGVPPPRQGDQVVIYNVAYEIIDELRDDLGEHGLQLHRANPRVGTWKDNPSGPDITAETGGRWY
jgi:hypothetical protein